MAEVIRYAMIKNGKIENISLWDGDVTKWTPPEDMLVISAPDHVGVGWTHDGVNWLEPIIEELPPEEP